MKTKILLIVLLLMISAVTVAGVNLEYGDIIMNRNEDGMKKAGVKPVLFPHWFHRIRFKCKVCHEEIFILEKGANEITMKAIMDGKFCGVCHNGRIAWEPLYCDRCHYAEEPKDKK